MEDGCTIVLDIGKTNAKASLWNSAGKLLARRMRPNTPQEGNYRALDVVGIDAWLMASVREFAEAQPVSYIVPVGHGAAAALLQGGRLAAAPMDYEDDLTPDERAEYDAARDAFAQTGSPALPNGLNLGAQLHRFERMFGPLPRDVTIVPWPQYWAWRLCGVAASEVSSLGCHTDLWRPFERRFSDLAVRRGWAARFAPVHAAYEPLGVITPEVAGETGLPPECLVLCGVHDSNAALLAARGHSVLAKMDTTVLSTGTWFVAMRSVAANAGLERYELDEARDCLINVDVLGRPVPSARFMGGREAELIAGIDSFAPTRGVEPAAQLQRLPSLLDADACTLPSFASGVGPFPGVRGEWCNKPTDPLEQRTLMEIYLALMADASLDLIGSQTNLLVEGRFAAAVVFTRALASLRPRQRVFVSHAENDVAYGAFRLVYPQLAPLTELASVAPLDIDIAGYASRWRARVHSAARAA